MVMKMLVKFNSKVSQHCPSLCITSMLSYPQLSFHDNVEHWRKFEKECSWTRGKGSQP